MTDQPISTRKITRRQFLKAGCLGTTAIGLTLCGATAVRPDPEPITLETNTYGEKTMNTRFLIVYATYAGSTMEIAEAIGETLGSMNCQADVLPAVDAPSPDGYDAVLLGSAVQNGNWLPEAFDYIRTHRKSLQELPLAIFSVHITNTGNDAKSRMTRQTFTDSVRALITPDAEVFFPGRFDRRGAQKMMPAIIARFIPTTNFLNFKKVRAWAENIPARLGMQVEKIHS